MQNLSCRHGRHLVIMRKHRRHTPADRDAYAQYICALLASKRSHPEGEGFGTLMLRLEKALSSVAFEDESVVKKQSASYLRRRQAKEGRRKMREGEPGAEPGSAEVEATPGSVSGDKEPGSESLESRDV